MDLDAYFRRIHHPQTPGTRPPPTLATLQMMVNGHVHTIPFENLDVLLGRGVSLDPDAVDQKLIHDRRGGYCFEQNTLMLRVLLALGFDARPISARVRIGRPADYTPARTHVFIRVEIRGQTWFADVGVGGLSPTSILRFNLDEEQLTPHETRRVIRAPDANGLPRYMHQALLGPVGGQTWDDVCEFTLEEMPAIDREVGNWYTSAHPQSHFRNRLIVARAGPDGSRLTLLNNELTIRDGTGVGATTPIRSPEALLEVLAREFGIAFPPGTTFPLAPSGAIVGA